LGEADIEELQHAFEAPEDERFHFVLFRRFLGDVGLQQRRGGISRRVQDARILALRLAQQGETVGDVRDPGVGQSGIANYLARCLAGDVEHGLGVGEWLGDAVVADDRVGR